MPKKIMFIDDDEHYIYLIERVCKGIPTVESVISATDGSVALKNLSKWVDDPQKLPDLLLVDINMPIMDGHEFLNRFKKVREEFPILKNIEPIVMLTSSQDKADKEKAFNTGLVKKYFIKPADIHVMHDFINQLTA